MSTKTYTYDVKMICEGAWSVRVRNDRGRIIASGPIFAHELHPFLPTVEALARNAAAGLLRVSGVSAFGF